MITEEGTSLNVLAELIRDSKADTRIVTQYCIPLLAPCPTAKPPSCVLGEQRIYTIFASAKGHASV